MTPKLTVDAEIDTLRKAGAISGSCFPPGRWYPIETAPLEERVMLWCEDNRNRPSANSIVFGRVVDFTNGERVAYGDGMNGPWTFTYWSPLPPPAPSPKSEGA